MGNEKAEYTFTKMDQERAHWVVPRVYPASRELQHYVDACFFTEFAASPIADERARRMPEGASYLVFLRGRRTADGINDEAMLVVGGAHDCIHEIPSWDYQFQCGLRIQPGAAAQVLGCPATALTNCITPLRDHWGSSAERLLERMRVAGSDAEAMGLLSDAVRAALSERKHTDLLTVRLAKALRSAPGGSRVSDLARRFGISVRTLERRFRDDVGLGPKQYQRIARMANVLGRVERSGGDWAGIAAACGYYDQSHLVEDCHEVLGQPPRRFLRNITKTESLEIGLIFEKAVDACHPRLDVGR